VLAVDALDDLEDLPGQPRRQPEARLVEQDQRRRGDERPGDRQHLLLAAGEQARGLPRPLAQDGEIGVGTLDVAGHRVAVGARVGAHQQVVAHREQREDLAPLGHVGEAEAHDPPRVLAGDLAAVEAHAAAQRLDDAGDGLEDRRLAGTVAAEHRGDLAAPHLEAHAADRADRPVGALDVGELEKVVAHRRRLAASPAAPR
jgi:hypothetical protein